MGCLRYKNQNWDYRIKFSDKKFNKKKWMRIFEDYLKFLEL